MGPTGTPRSAVSIILLSIVTLGIYGLWWQYATFKEMKDHSGTGLGGGLALVLAIFVGFVNPFLMASEVGGLYERSGRTAPVSAVTGVWILLPLVGIIVWLVKTQGALNDYWKQVPAAVASPPAA